jgi:hypothetical protein
MSAFSGKVSRLGVRTPIRRGVTRRRRRCESDVNCCPFILALPFPTLAVTAVTRGVNSRLPWRVLLDTRMVDGESTKRRDERVAAR